MSESKAEKFKVDEFVLDALEKLRYASIAYRLNLYSEEEVKLYEERAARILANCCPSPQQFKLPTPIPIAVCKPKPRDCNAELECWATDYKPNLCYSPVWSLRELPRKNLRRDLDDDFSNSYFWRNVTYWLPAFAFPLRGDYPPLTET